MKVSVIIPTFNRANLLSRALDSVLQQHQFDVVNDLELIVVDDGSSDHTEELIKQYQNQANGDVIRYLRQCNKGVSAARNLGITHAQHDWVALLDSDDEWLPMKLHTQAAAIQQNGLEICHTHEIWIRNGVRVNQMNKHQKYGGDIFHHCLPLCAMSPSSIMIHRRVFDRIGMFDESLPACEDYDLWVRITAHYAVAYVDTPCINKYGGHDDQLSRQHWGMDRFRVLALSKLLQQTQADLKLSTSQQEQTLAMLEKKNQVLLLGAHKHNNQALIAECEQRIAEFGLGALNPDISPQP